MKTAYWIGAVIVVLVVLGLIVHLMSSSNTSEPGAATSTASNQGVPAADSTLVSSTSTSVQTSAQVSASAVVPKVTPTVSHFTVNGNDETADLKVIKVAANTPVSITFGADAGTTYHEGLDFRSSVVNTGTIVPGSTKSVSFTATKSFSFTPYWPATNIAKPYTIDIVVQ